MNSDKTRNTNIGYLEYLKDQTNIPMAKNQASIYVCL